MKCTQTDNASVWASDFVRTMREQEWSLEDIDEGLMLGWFANAIEISTDIRIRCMDKVATAYDVEDLAAALSSPTPTTTINEVERGITRCAVSDAKRRSTAG